MPNPYRLFLDRRAGKLLRSPDAYQLTSLQEAINAGDDSQIPIELIPLDALDGGGYEVASYATDDVRLAIGNTSEQPTAGTFVIDHDTFTSEVFYVESLTTDSLERGLNGITSIYAAGGVQVIEDGKGWIMQTIQNGILGAITADEQSLAPHGTVKIVEISPGTATTKAAYKISLVADPYALLTSWEALDAAAVAISTITPGASTIAETQQIAITGAVSGGYFTVTDGTTVSASLAHDASASQVEDAINGVLGASTVTVTKPNSCCWHVRWAAVGNQDILTVTGALTSWTGLAGTIELNTVSLASSIAGQGRIPATAQIIETLTSADEKHVYQEELELNETIISNATLTTIANGLLPDLKATAVFTSATRAAEIPDFVGQVGVETDTNSVYQSTGTGAGDWQLQFTGNPRPEYFGAKVNDASYDCRSEIQYCLDTFGVCELGVGTYYVMPTQTSAGGIGAAIYIGDGETLKGQGKGVSILKLIANSINASYDSGKRCHMIISGSATNTAVFYQGGEIDNTTIADLTIDLNGDNQVNGTQVCTAGVVLTGNFNLVKNVDVFGHRAGTGAECFCISLSQDHGGGVEAKKTYRTGDIIGCSVHDPASVTGSGVTGELTSILLSGKPRFDGRYIPPGRVEGCHVYNIVKTGTQISQPLGITAGGVGCVITNNIIENIDGPMLWMNGYTRTEELLFSNNVGNNVNYGVHIQPNHPRIQYLNITAENNVIHLGSSDASDPVYGTRLYTTATTFNYGSVTVSGSNVVIPSVDGVTAYKQGQIYITSGTSDLTTGIYYIKDAVVSGTDTLLTLASTIRGTDLTPSDGNCSAIILAGYCDGFTFRNNTVTVDSAHTGESRAVQISSNRGVFNGVNGGGWRRVRCSGNTFDGLDFPMELRPNGAVDLTSEFVCTGNIDAAGDPLTVLNVQTTAQSGIPVDNAYLTQQAANISYLMDERFVGASPGFDSGWTEIEDSSAALTTIQNNLGQSGSANLACNLKTDRDATRDNYSALQMLTGGIVANSDGYDYVVDFGIKLTDWGTYKDWTAMIGMMSEATTGIETGAFSDGIYLRCNPTAANYPAHLSMRSGSTEYYVDTNADVMPTQTQWHRIVMLIKGDFSQCSVASAIWSSTTPPFDPLLEQSLVNIEVGDAVTGGTVIAPTGTLYPTILISHQMASTGGTQTSTWVTHWKVGTIKHAAWNA